MAKQLTYQQYYHMRPDEFRDGDEIAVKLVLVLGHGGDYALFAGFPADSADHVARHGDKELFRERVAETLFKSAVMGRYLRS